MVNVPPGKVVLAAAEPPLVAVITLTILET